MASTQDSHEIMIHGLPVKVVWQLDGQVVYSCPWHGCSFQTHYSCHDDDVECRLTAYVEMHDHLKTHKTGLSPWVE